MGDRGCSCSSTDPLMRVPNIVPGHPWGILDSQSPKLSCCSQVALGYGIGFALHVCIRVSTLLLYNRSNSDSSTKSDYNHFIHRLYLASLAVNRLFISDLWLDVCSSALLGSSCLVFTTQWNLLLLTWQNNCTAAASVLLFFNLLHVLRPFRFFGGLMVLLLYEFSAPLQPLNHLIFLTWMRSVRVGSIIVSRDESHDLVPW